MMIMAVMTTTTMVVMIMAKAAAIINDRNDDVTAHGQTDDVCIRLMTCLQTCESLVTFANITLCKHEYVSG